MKRNLLIAAMLATGAVAGPTFADQIELTGVIRDFKESHIDMQASFGEIAVRTNLVKSTLGSDGKPMLNTAVDFKKGKINSASSFAQWYNDTPGVNMSQPYTLIMSNGQAEAGGVYSVAWDKNVKINGKPQYFFPIDNVLWGDKGYAADGKYHNFYFTFELHTQFTYTDPAKRNFPLTFSFMGDDDVWVFINGKLAIDLGGVHAQSTLTSVNLDQKAAQLGLTPGHTYTLDFFSAERYLTESNLRIDTTLQLQAIPPTSTSPLYD